MAIHPRYASLLFGVILSAVMVTIVSGTVLALNQGITPDFLPRWAKSFAGTFPIALPTVLVVAPMVRRLVCRLTGQ